MGISSNQARFLALTSRQIDLEHRIQQICQRRLRLTSELENVATSYNNKISNRRLYTMNSANSGIGKLTVANITSLKDTNGNNYLLTGHDTKTTGSTPLWWMSVTATYNHTDFNAATSTVYGGANTITDSETVLKFGGTSYTLKDLGLKPGATEEETIEAALRAGLLVIAPQADEYTQDDIWLNGGTGTKVDISQDWRTIPAIADELYSGDDVDAENKYDKTVEEINAQDKKLQLEQTSIEVEYKAITSEKESVKKILDTNAQASFKYFS